MRRSRSRRSASAVAVAVAVAVLLMAAIPARAGHGRVQPGDLDPSFGNQGKVVKNLHAESAANDVATLGSGKLMVVGFKGSRILLMRFTADGHLDTSFSGDGKVTTSISGKTAAADSVAIVAGGRILVAGPVNVTGQPDSEDVLVARYLPNGQPDPSFGGGDGRVIADMFGGDDQFEDMAVGSDGKAVVATEAEQRGTLKASLVRFTADGTLDHSFSTDGKFVLPQSAHPFIEAVAVLPSLKIVAAGQGEPASTLDFVVYQVKKGGRIDQGFGTFGLAATDFGDGTDVADALLVDSQGRIVAGGAGDVAGDESFALARYTTTGQPDTTFSHDGKATLNLESGFDRIFALAFQGRKIVAGGRSDLGNDERWALARFGPKGAVNEGFGSGGATTVDFSTDVNLEEEIAALTFESGPGRIVGAGFIGNRLALAGFVG